MKLMLALLSLIASPAFGQEFTVTTTLVKPLTGPDSPSEMKSFDICGTDIGTMAEVDGTIVIAFGDTFGWQGDNLPEVWAEHAVERDRFHDGRRPLGRGHY
jgi:hypothetical protein